MACKRETLGRDKRAELDEPFVIRAFLWYVGFAIAEVHQVIFSILFYANGVKLELTEVNYETAAAF